MEFSSKVTLITSVVVIAACCGGATLLISPLTDVVSKREEGAIKYGDQVVSTVLTDWSPQSLEPFANDVMRDSLDDKGFKERLAGNKKALGNFVSGKSKANLVGTRKSNGKTTMLVRYENNAKFENASAVVRLDLK